LERVYRLFDGAISINDKVSKDTIRAYHTFIKNATQYMEEFKLNLVVSQMMIFTNHCYETKNISKLMLSSLVIILSCFSPFIAEEL
jgi:leucyl-tRNA synthetase